MEVNFQIYHYWRSECAMKGERMRYAIKANNANGGRKIVKAYCLGENTEMERKLLQEGAMRKHGDGHYELFSQEARDGKGQTAQPGDYFKVDVIEGKHYPYPNDREFFLKNHRHLAGDEYEQLGRPRGIWQVGDEMCEEIQYLLDNGKLTIHPEMPERYFQAVQDTSLSAAKDATIVFYGIEKDADGKILDINFNFVARPEFERDYCYCKESGEIFDLARFHDAQQTAWANALTEIKAGQKQSHWMWYIFPQIRGLGMSMTSQYYGIQSLDEAKAYLADPVLGSRLREISGELLKLDTANAMEVFGCPDNMKLNSSMTLFEKAGEGTEDALLFAEVIEKFFGGARDRLTLERL